MGDAGGSLEGAAVLSVDGDDGAGGLEGGEDGLEEAGVVREGGVGLEGDVRVSLLGGDVDGPVGLRRRRQGGGREDGLLGDMGVFPRARDLRQGFVAAEASTGEGD